MTHDKENPNHPLFRFQRDSKICLNVLLKSVMTAIIRDSCCKTENGGLYVMQSTIQKIIQLRVKLIPFKDLYVDVL